MIAVPSRRAVRGAAGILLVLTAFSGALAAAGPASTIMVPMRDGVRLSTDVYRPAGSGAWPAIVQRTPYNRRAARQPEQAAGLVDRGYVYVVQDWRGQFGSEGKYDSLSPEGGERDGYDTVEWIAGQPWCNGKVGIMGGSGPGIAALQTVIARPPHLVAAAVSVATAFPHERQALNGGVMQNQSARWLAQRGFPVPEWPRPSTWIVDQVLVGSSRPPAAETPNPVALLHVGGWFDIFGDAPLTQLARQDPHRSRAIVGPTGHGGRTTELPFPSARHAGPSQADWFDYWLKGARNGALDAAPVRYYLMGDARNPRAPGNVWKEAERWPVPHQPASFFLRFDGSLTRAEPGVTDAARGYRNDPRDPVPTLGGSIMGPVQGPSDQRPLAGRADILRFATAPLETPVEITGPARAELWITSDAPDTTFMVKLLDRYPDGYEALILDSAIMTRYRDGFVDPTPLEPGRRYKLAVELGSTALVFDQGHQIAVHVSSSSAPKFEVHPNTFAGVRSYDEAKVARNTVHVSKAHASRLILPLIVASQPGRD
jgi:predicted acyl esterase